MWNREHRVAVSVEVTDRSVNGVSLVGRNNNPVAPEALGLINPGPATNNNELPHFDIRLFNYTIEERVGNRGPDVLFNYITAIMAHEIAHAFGLRDAGDSTDAHGNLIGNPPLGGSSNGSMMNWTRDRTVVYAPTIFDIESINLIPRRHQ